MGDAYIVIAMIEQVAITAVNAIMMIAQTMLRTPMIFKVFTSRNRVVVNTALFFFY